MKPNEYELMSTNSASKKIRDLKRILLLSSCIRNEYPDVYRDLVKDHVVLHVCMESYHINMVSLKVASILARVNVRDITILTVDGSPHCVQLHTAVEEAVKITGSHLNIKHLVISNGKLIEVSNNAVKLSRYLSKIEKLLNSIAKES